MNTINMLRQYAWAIAILVAIVISISFYYKHSIWCKAQYANIRRHKILFSLLLILSVTCVRMFIQNYDLQTPIVNKRAESYVAVWNTRAACLDDLARANQIRDTANADILK